MQPEEVWKNYCRESGTSKETPHSAWAFGSFPDALAALVLKGVKTATASGYDLYFVPGEEEPLPKVGEYSVILNASGEALCVIRTTSVRILPYGEVGSDHAYKEGEGDRSLSYWRNVHWQFFTEEYRSYGMAFTENSQVVCEEFGVVYKV